MKVYIVKNSAGHTVMKTTNRRTAEHRVSMHHFGKLIVQKTDEAR